MHKFIYLNKNNNDSVIINNTITEKFVISFKTFNAFFQATSLQTSSGI